MKRVTSVLAVFLILGSGLFADKSSLRVMIWDSTNGLGGVDVPKEVVEKFQKDNPDIDIKLEEINSDQYKTKLATEMAANIAADVFMTWSAGFLKPYVEAGKVYSIADDLAKDKEWAGRYKSGVFDALSYGGKAYGIPGNLSTVALYYNKEIFAKYKLKAPKTYADFKQAVKVLNANGVTPLALGNKSPWVGGLFSEVVIQRLGTTAAYKAVANGTGTWEDPVFAKAGAFMQDLVAMKALPKGFAALDPEGMSNLFIQGKAAMIVQGSWVIGSIIGKDSQVNGKVGVLPFPSIEGGTGSINSWLGQPNGNLAINQNAKDKAAAVRLLKAFSEPWVGQRYMEGTGDLLVTKTDTSSFKVNPLTKELNSLMGTMDEFYVFYDVQLGPVIGNEFNNTIAAIMAGANPKTQFAKLQKFSQDNQ